MFELQIADIDLRMPLQDFEKAFQDCIDNYHETMHYNIKQLRTKHGKSMYKMTVDNGNGSELDIVAEQDDVSGDVMFHPIKLSNMNNSFYDVRYSDPSINGQGEDPCMFVCYAFKTIARNIKGSFAAIDTTGSSFIIKDGSSKSSATLALVDGDGNVYSCYGAKNVKSASEGVDFSVKKPIGEWLSENPRIQMQISSLPSIDQKMNVIGKYLIQEKVAENIDADEFMDIFCQAGILGFSDPTVLNIYKLLM